MKELSKDVFVIYQNEFRKVLGADAKVTIIAENSYNFAHEAGVWIGDEIFYTSNRIMKEGEEAEQMCEIGKINVKTNKFEKIETDIKMANGGTNYQDGVLFCEQGTFSNPGAITYMDPKTYQTKRLVTEFYGRQFNSPNDVVVMHGNGTIWFTDPSYGYGHEYKPKPMLPNHVYAFHPDKPQDIRVVADGFMQPNGICFSPDEKVCYISDTGLSNGFKGDINYSRPATM